MRRRREIRFDGLKNVIRERERREILAKCHVEQMFYDITHEKSVVSNITDNHRARQLQSQITYEKVKCVLPIC